MVSNTYLIEMMIFLSTEYFYIWFGFDAPSSVFQVFGLKQEP